MQAIPLEPPVIAALVAVTLLQSVFGVGVLLFGTPILLLLGHAFPDVLALLLPISIAISLSQALPNRRHVDRGFVGRVLLFAVPVIVGVLALALRSSTNLGFLIAAVLLLFGMRTLWPPLDRALSRFAAHEVSALLITGAVHGASNLGGSLLTVLVQQKGLGKDGTRATIAAAYALFAMFQLATLLAGHEEALAAVAGNARFIVLGLGVYAMSNVFVYRRLDSQRYAQAFALFLIFSGLVLALRSMG